MKKKPAAERFWDKVRKTKSCWIWVGVRSKSKGGYGNFWANDKCVRPSRFVYELCCGKILNGLFVLHKCDNPSCVRPDHLFLGTNQDNMDDMKRKGRSPNNKGINNPRAKLNPSKVSAIKRMLQDSTISRSTIAGKYGVSESMIQFINLGTNWKEVP